MANDTTTIMSNSLKTAYLVDYMQAAFNERLYDQFATAQPQDDLKYDTLKVPFVSKLKPATAAISEVADITPKTLRDALATITPTSRGDAIQCSETLMLRTYTNYGKRRFEIIGEQQMDSVDLVAQAAALKGKLIQRAAARASLDAGTTTHRLQRSDFLKAGTLLANMLVPYYVTPSGKRWFALTNPFAYADLISATPILEVGEYQDKRIILNFEMGELGNFRIIASPKAKMFLGAGAANASAIATTIAASTGTNYSNQALALTIEVADATNIDAGDKIMIGTIETGDTHYSTNEWVEVASVSGTTITIIGGGENGGLQYDHEVGETVSNADFVVPTAFGGPESLGKVYASEIGEYGEVVGPKKVGVLDQFLSLGWKWHGGYGIISENRILRVETSTSFNA